MNKKKTLLVSVLAATLATTFTACATGNNSSTANPSSSSQVVSSSENASSSEASVAPSSSEASSEQQKFTVTYVTGELVEAPAAVSDVLALPETLPTPSVEGYRFIGWFLDSNFTTAAVAGSAIEANTSLYAKFELIVNNVSFEVVNDESVSVPAITVGTKFEGLPVPSVEGSLFNGWYKESECKTLIKEGTAITADTKVFGKIVDAPADREATEAVQISTVEEFLAFRNGVEEGNDEKNYVLMNDIDLKDVELKATKVTFTGVFDGNGHSIKNAVYTGAAAKTGILVSKLIGGEIKNVKFVGCTVESTNESAAIVAGEINEGGVVKNVEVKNSAVKSTGNYGGIIYARSEGTTGVEVLLDNITIKNNCSVTCGQYGGLVTGDNVANVTLRNSSVEGKLIKSSNNYGLLLGRTRNDAQIYRLENVIANVVYDGTISSSCGFVCQGKNKCSVVAKNVLVIDANCDFAGAAGIAFVENVHYVNKAKMPTLKNVKAIEVSAVTSDWMKNSLLSNFDANWVVETDTSVRVKGSTANVVGPNDKLVSVELYTNRAKTRFKKGEEFTGADLVVAGTYDSEITVNLTADKYTVDSTAFNKDVAGTYTIKVKVPGTEIEVTYNVTVVEQTGFRVEDEFVKKTFMLNEDFSATNLLAYSVWSDGVEEKIDVASLTMDTSAYDKAHEGTYEIVCKSTGFADQKYVVEVTGTAKPEVVDNKVSVVVDCKSNAINGTVVNGKATFTSIQNALDFLESCNYDAAVKKEINLKDGVYREKLTISLDNLVLKGETREGTKIVYNAVESTINPFTGAKYMLTCATVHVNASGFEAHNLSIVNDFDYKNNQYNPVNAAIKETDPQGIALTLNGDKFIIENCHLAGNQDTLYLKAGRAYFKGGIIEGNIDFIFGEAKGIGFFDEVNVNAVGKGLTAKDMSNNGYVTAMKGDTGSQATYGIIFNKCKFTADADVPNGSMSLGRPWGKYASVAYLECDFSAAYSKLAYDGKAKSRWADMSGNSPVNAFFVEYKSTGAGAISTAVAGGKILSDEEAAKYTLANAFGTKNGDFSFTTAFDPTSDVPAVDNNTYYYFNGQKSASGTSYTYTLDTEKIEGKKVADWNGISVDGSKGKVTSRGSDTQINAGGTLKFTVPAHSVVVIENHAGYHGYSINGVETYKDQLSVYYAEETEVTFTALATVYLWSIIVMPNQEAPEAATTKELVLSGVPSVEVATGEDVDLSKLVVKEYLTDGSIKNLVKDTDYTIDLSGVNKDEAGTYTVKVVYGQIEKTFQVTYVATVSNAISETTTFSFKDDTSNAASNYFVYGNDEVKTTLQIGKLTLDRNTTGTIVNNGDWIQFYGGAQAKFEVAGACTLKLDMYNNMATIKVTVNGTEVIANADGSYSLTKGNVVIEGTATQRQEYIGHIYIVF